MTKPPIIRPIVRHKPKGVHFQARLHTRVDGEAPAIEELELLRGYWIFRFSTTRRICASARNKPIRLRWKLKG